MSYEVLIEKEATKGLKKAPENVQNKFYKWVQLVESLGLLTVRKVLGFHDEPLKEQTVKPFASPRRND